MRPGCSNRYCGRGSARRRYLVVLVLTCLPLLILPAAATSAGPPLTVSCSGGGCSGGWYTTNVTVTFAWDPSGVTSTRGCDTNTVSSDTTGTTFRCTVTYDNGATASLAVTIKRDATPPTMNGGSANRGSDANGWYNHPVAITFNGSDATSGIAGCTSTTYAGPDTGGVSFSGACTDQAGNSSGTVSFGPIKYDATAPSSSASLSRGPDTNGWYNRPVDFSASGSDNLSGIASCSSGTYSGPDVGGGSIGAGCTDNAGNSSSQGLGINYDSTPPTVTGVNAARPPDSNGWYNHAVAIAFAGSDGASGIASCTNLTYDGPESPGTTVNGSCTDVAGNTGGGGTFTLKYDSTPPTLTDVRVESDNNLATLFWTASADTKAIEVVRAPGPSGPDPATVFTGLASTYEDTTVVNRVKYVYTVTGFDEAGNKAVETISVIPAARLYSPARGAVVKSPPLLSWRKIPGASYYNVQVYFGGSGQAIRQVLSVQISGRKVLSAWPTGPRYRMRKQWVFKKKHHKLARGHYTWYVWPGLGKRSARNYGKLFGKSDFIVSR
jgi:hypothetical protein